MHRVAIAILLVCLAGAAHAQPGMVPATPIAHPDEVSEDTALALSLGGTVGSYAAIGLAVAMPQGEIAGLIGTAGLLGGMFAPSFGHWYSHKIITRGLLLRGGGFVVAIIGAIADSEGCSLVYSGHGDEEPADCGDNFRTAKGTAIMIAGALMFLGGTVDDIVTAPRRARRYNESLRTTLTLAPLVRTDGGGLALVGRF